MPGPCVADRRVGRGGASERWQVEHKGYPGKHLRLADIWQSGTISDDELEWYKAQLGLSDSDFERLKTRVGFKVKYVGGMPPETIPTGRTGMDALIEIHNDQIDIAVAGISHKYPLAEVRYISYESAGTKMDVGAVALFGVQLGARKSWSVISVGLEGTDAQFLIKEPIYEIRRRFQVAAQGSPSLLPLLSEGTPAESGPTKGTTLDELERLAKLYQDDLLTDDEYTAMKAKLIADS